jgi:membrane protein YdbS with pleckstrin-like domain
MSKKEMLDKEFQDLREKRQSVFAIFMALLTAFGVIAYAVLSGDKPIYMFLASAAILVFMSVLAWKIHIYNLKIDENITETKDL